VASFTKGISVMFTGLKQFIDFYKCRWGDGPVRSIAAAMFLKREDIHFFNEIGYNHDSIKHCPFKKSLIKNCSCDYRGNHSKLLILLFYMFD
jgi:alpha 1,2-mannosyltransferase